MKTKIAILAAFALALSPLSAAERWKMQFFHDKENSTLEIRDLQCPSATICIAAAALAEGHKDKPKGTLVMTADGGEHWSFVEAKEIPYSLFFLNPTQGWMVTDRGIWDTADGGQNWKKLKALKGIERVWFLDASHGFAVGELKSVYETKDGGKEWTKRVFPDPASPMDPQDTLFDWIAFSGTKRGLIAGSWDVAHRPKETEWLNPSRGHGKNTALLLETNDGGQNWNYVQVLTGGKFTRLRYLNDSDVLGLVEYSGSDQVPSEIFKMNLETRAGSAVFKQSGRVGRDVAVLPNGEVIVAAVELMGKSALVPIPGKLKLMSSTSLATWLDEKVDYRANAMQPILAVVDTNHVWVATDTGMILKRVNDATPGK